MAIPDRNINFRETEDTLEELQAIQQLFHPYLPDRSATLRWIIRKFWEVLFTDTNLIDVLKQWQVIHGNTSQHKQLKLVFSEPMPSFFPKIGNWRDAPITRMEE